MEVVSERGWVSQRGRGGGGNGEQGWRRGDGTGAAAASVAESEFREMREPSKHEMTKLPFY
jgi:hypothetical protein